MASDNVFKKECRSCNTVKNSLEFCRRTASVDGLSAKCKECQKEYDRRRANLPHRVKARSDYAKTEQGLAAGSRAKKAWIDRNTIKRAASTIVGNAVRDGRILKQDSCEQCKSKPSRLHGHHDDYAFPLVVRWLCPGCHNKWHKENGEGANAS